jgi:hypothetical protein
MLNQKLKPTQQAIDVNTKQINPAIPILIIGTTAHLAIPYDWARTLNHLIAKSRLITLKGEGHTCYGRGSACTNHATNKYLTSGKVPAKTRSASYYQRTNC